MLNTYQIQKSFCLWMAFNLDYLIWDLALYIVTLLLDIWCGITVHVFIPCTGVICHHHYLVILWLWCLTPQYVSYIMGVSFIDGRYWNTWRKPTTCRKSLTNFITSCCSECTSPWTGYELTTLAVIVIYCTASCKSNYHMITTTTTLTIICFLIGWYKKVKET